MHPIHVLALTLLLVWADTRCLHAATLEATQGQATRIVSLDYCADQYVLQFAAAENILALSPEAVQEFSYLREQARGFPSVRPIVENVISIKPDLVVRSYGGGYGIVEVLDQLEIPVVQIGYANTLAEVQQSVLTVSAALGAAHRGEDLVAAMRKRLPELSLVAGKVKGSALYTTPTGVTAGPGTLIHDLLLAAGFENFEDKPGWRALPLERLVYSGPDVVAQAFYQSAYGHRDLWSAAAHPVTQRQLANSDSVALDGAWTSCGGWFLMDAVEALFAERTGEAARADQAEQ